MVVVTDAKDVFDKGNSDTPSYGSQKSLAFTVAWLRGMLSHDTVSLKWTATENMFVDCGTKEMDGEHMRRILSAGEWSYRYDPKYVKQTTKKATKAQCGPPVLSGEAVAASDPVTGFLQGLAPMKGWHRRDDLAIQVAYNAKSFRRPEPRFDPQKYSLRTSYALFHDEHGRGSWRVLERDKAYSRHQAPLDRTAAILITIFKSPKERALTQHGCWQVKRESVPATASHSCLVLYGMVWYVSLQVYVCLVCLCVFVYVGGCVDVCMQCM